ncbi:uncharacterized protein LOC119102486 [Pollicipes pollicipes]|uniref:uncharacterized protein LOC119102486 n=1 Tax=Pollicipes pollicipes TaxID=41117 RepID=UPI001884C28F|nr:uncharacterized protein LOC119102486 [Pollicipes pollicipes]
MGGFKLSQQTPANMTRAKGVPVVTEAHAAEEAAGADGAQLQRALKRTRQHLQLQETRSRQLVSACAAKLREKQAEADRLAAQKDRQLQRILQQLAVLQSKLKREQKLIWQEMAERDQLTQQQARELERLRRANRRLLGKVTRLSAPCARCGTKPDSGISDCDEADDGAAPKVAKVVGDGSPDSALASSTGESSDTASPPTAERGIMKSSRETRKATQKTVTFSLHDKENKEMQRKPKRPPLPIKPRLILPPSTHGDGSASGKPSIVDTISQLLGADLEAAGGRRPPPHMLSVIPEDLETSREEPAARLHAAGGAAGPTGQSAATQKAADTAPGGDTDDEEEQQQKPRNAPRSRSNINLIMSEREGVKIKDNFEEFKFDDDLTGSACSDTASERSADNGRDQQNSFDRRAGDGAESVSPDQRPPPANYDKFLEQSGLSQKSIRTPKRLFTNHRSMLKPSDVKYRHRSKMSFEGFTIEDISPTSVRYYSEEL